MPRTFIARAIYIWVAGQDTHHDIRSKERTIALTDDPASVTAECLLREKAFPEWNFDGSSTRQAKGVDTEVLLRPVRAFRFAPMRPDGEWHTPRFLVLCECHIADGQPTPDNSRCAACAVFDHPAVSPMHPWFGLEQEFVLMERGRPLHWPADGVPAPQGPYYCATGSAAWGRDIVDEFYDWALKIGLKISGTNAEVMPAQWEYQVGPCEGIEAGDHAIVARWLLLRVLEARGPQYDVSFAARPVGGDWNGSGMHTNFSTEDMRKPGGIDAILSSIERLASSHGDDVLYFGSDNAARMSGRHETSSLEIFSHGVGTRHTSVRIPNAVQKARCGYLEDRRPSGSADPYVVTARIAASALGLPSPSLFPFCSAIR